MKVNSRALKTSILVSIVLLISSIVFFILSIKFKNNVVLEFINDILLGSFCSSVITIFFYSSAYKVEKTRVLEAYWIEIRKLLNILYKVEYLYLEYDEQTVINFFNEKQSNKWNKIANQIAESNTFEIKTKYSELLSEEIIGKNKDVYYKLSKDYKEEFINNELEKFDLKITENIDKIIEQYINVTNHSTENLTNLLGDIEFFKTNKEYKNIYKLYNELIEVKKKIQSEIHHFNYYKEKCGNKLIVIEKILQLQKIMFRKEEIEVNEFEGILIYNDFIDNMERKLENFRAKTIYNMEPEYTEITPVLQNLRNKNYQI